MDFLHCALLALVVLLAVYVARGSGLFREGALISIKRRSSDPVSRHAVPVQAHVFLHEVPDITRIRLSQGALRALGGLNSTIQTL